MTCDIDRSSKLWKDICLARYVADHRFPKQFAGKLVKRHGEEFVAHLRDLLKEYGR